MAGGKYDNILARKAKIHFGATAPHPKFNCHAVACQAGYCSAKGSYTAYTNTFGMDTAHPTDSPLSYDNAAHYQCQQNWPEIGCREAVLLSQEVMVQTYLDRWAMLFVHPMPADLSL